MKIIWEEIYNNSHIEHCSYYEATYRDKVIGGWLIRHETCCDYQYDNLTDEENVKIVCKWIEEDGYQNVKNSLIFIPDRSHKWEFDIMDGIGNLNKED